mmetsp:Transcript_92398/g.261588  ORF Transcript_92398/g.261588 Transcript_92398/m.261588 type:complete len:243 (+) Transcript_92398:210-938(+)
MLALLAMLVMLPEVTGMEKPQGAGVPERWFESSESVSEGPARLRLLPAPPAAAAPSAGLGSLAWIRRFIISTSVAILSKISFCQETIRLLKYMRVARSIAVAGPRSRRTPCVNSSQSMVPDSSVSSSRKRARASFLSISSDLKNPSKCGSFSSRTKSSHSTLPSSFMMSWKSWLTCFASSASLSTFAADSADSTNTPVTTLSIANTTKAMYTENPMETQGFGIAACSKSGSSWFQSTPPVMA